MAEHQKTTAILLVDGDIPVNEHRKIERIVLVDSTKGQSLQAILDDLEARVTALEP